MLRSFRYRGGKNDVKLQLADTSSLGVCVAFLLKLCKLAKPVEMPCLCGNTHSPAGQRATSRCSRVKQASTHTLASVYTLLEAST